MEERYWNDGRMEHWNGEYSDRIKYFPQKRRAVEYRIREKIFYHPLPPPADKSLV
jgi:hypothetical protein